MRLQLECGSSYLQLYICSNLHKPMAMTPPLRRFVRRPVDIPHQSSALLAVLVRDSGTRLDT